MLQKKNLANKYTLFKNYLDCNNVDANVKKNFKITVEVWNNIENTVNSI